MNSGHFRDVKVSIADGNGGWTEIGKVTSLGLTRSDDSCGEIRRSGEIRREALSLPSWPYIPWWTARSFR